MAVGAVNRHTFAERRDLLRKLPRDLFEGGQSLLSYVQIPLMHQKQNVAVAAVEKAIGDRRHRYAVVECNAVERKFAFRRPVDHNRWNA